MDLDSCFAEKKIGKAVLDTLGIGMVSFSKKIIIARDPLIELAEEAPYIQTVPAVNYLVMLTKEKAAEGIYYSLM